MKIVEKDKIQYNFRCIVCGVAYKQIVRQNEDFILTVQDFECSNCISEQSGFPERFNTKNINFPNHLWVRKGSYDNNIYSIMKKLKSKLLK